MSAPAGLLGDVGHWAVTGVAFARAAVPMGSPAIHYTGLMVRTGAQVTGVLILQAVGAGAEDHRQRVLRANSRITVPIPLGTIACHNEINRNSKREFA